MGCSNGPSCGALPSPLEGRIVPGALFPKCSACASGRYTMAIGRGEPGYAKVSSLGQSRTREIPIFLSVSTLPTSGPGAAFGRRQGHRLPSGAQEIAALPVSWEAGVPLPPQGSCFVSYFGLAT